MMLILDVNFLADVGLEKGIGGAQSHKFYVAH